MVNNVHSYYINLFKKSFSRLLFNFKNFGFKVGVIIFLSEIFDFHSIKKYKISLYIKKKRNDIICETLLKKYSNLINKYETEEKDIGVNQKKIWCLWWQGIENAPVLVKKCINNIEKYSGDYKLIIITKDNFKDFIDIPVEIIQKVENGKISLTHFSDILRNGLLSIYGGVWIDSTMFVCDYIFKEFDDIIYNCNGKFSTFFMGGKPNKIFAFLYDILIQYNLEYDEFISYFLMDCILRLIYITFNDCKEYMNNTTFNNHNAFYFLNNFSKPFDNNEFEYMCKEYKFFKLSYKPTKNYKKYDENGNLTYYGYFMEKF